MNIVKQLTLVSAAMLMLSCLAARATEPWERDTPQEAANKKLVLDFWRVVYEAHHVELADKYLTPEYIQHNPNIASGRDAIVKLFSRTGPIDIKPQLMMPPVMTIAKGDMVLMVQERDELDPTDKTKMITSFGFDLMRIKNGKINEHWDAARPNPPGTVYQSPPPPWVRYDALLKARGEQQQAIQEKAAQQKAAQGKPQ